LNHPPIVNTKPNVVYQLDFVYGVETTDNRKHLAFNTQGELVYMAASTGIILDWVATPM